MVKYITFNLDAFPLTDNLYDVNDYNAILVYSAISDPLFKYDGNNIAKNAAKEYKVSFTGKKHVFIIRDDLKNAQGRSINATHYKEVLETIITNTNNRIRCLLDNVKKITATGDKLTIFLYKKDFQFYKILSGVNFSPVCGLYTIKTKTKNTILLTPNKYHRDYTPNTKNLKFKLVPKSSNDIMLLKNDKADFTSNTNLSHKQINRNKRFLHVYPNFITCSLTFLNPLFFAKSNKNLRCFIRDSIKKSAIAGKIDNIITPTDNYFIADVNCDFLRSPLKKFDSKNKKFTLGYDDFYPNYIIAYGIKEQLEQNGMSIELVKDDYFNPKLNYDMKVTLSYPDYIDDISFYRSKYVQTLTKILHAKAYTKYYKKLFRKTIAKETLQKLNFILHKEALIIPLFKMNSIYLSKNNTFDFRRINYEQL